MNESTHQLDKPEQAADLPRVTETLRQLPLGPSQLSLKKVSYIKGKGLRLEP